MQVKVNQPYRIKINGKYRTYNPLVTTDRSEEAKIYQGDFSRISSKISKEEHIPLEHIQQELISIVVN